MKNESENIDRYFKVRLDKIEQNPPEATWDIIAKKLGHKRKKGMALLLFRVAAGMAILISTGIGYYLFTKPANQTKPVVLSINKGDASPNDTIKIKRPFKRNPVAEPEKKAAKSDRLEPVRKVYKGPALSEKTTSGQSAQIEVIENPGKAVHQRDQFQSTALAQIADYNGQYLLPVYLPSELAHTRLSPITGLNTEEALTLLMPMSEEAIETDQIKQNRWTLGSEIAPLYSHRSIASNYEQADIINELNEAESGLLAYAGGIRVAFATNKRLSVQAGIYYSRYGQEKNKAEAYSYRYADFTSQGITDGTYISVTNSTGVISSDHPENAGFDKVVSSNVGETYNLNNMNGLMQFDNSDLTPPEDIDVTFTQYFDYLEVPLLVKYKVIDRKFDFSFSGGIVTNFLVSSIVNITQDGKTSRFGETTDINNINYQGSFGLGFEYPLVPGFAITFEPRFRYYINPIYKTFNVHPYSFGLFAGLSYFF